MTAETNVKLDKNSFERLKKAIRNMSVTSRERKLDPLYAASLPNEVGLQLTSKCNLRCSHCFEWNEQGYFKDADKCGQHDEIDLEIIKTILKDTREVKSNLYLWGGEPLCYSSWEELCKMLENDPRWTVICTNGTLIEKKMDSILKISENAVMLVSLDGFSEENDIIRGKGVFQKVINGIDLLLDEQRKGRFKGCVSVNCVISDKNAAHLYELTRYLEEKNIDTFYIGFPWYISEQMADEMDQYYKERFSWLKILEEGRRATWHCYKYRLNPSTIPIVKEQMQKISERQWNIRVRFQPEMNQNEIDGFILGYNRSVQCKKECIALSNRMDVLATGRVSSCKLFLEFDVGNLKNDSLQKIWQGSAFNKIREILSSELMPVCFRCVLLYLHGK